MGISKDTLRRWEKRNRLKAFRSPTNRRFYTKKGLDKAMSAGFQTKIIPTNPANKATVSKTSINKPKRVIIVIIGFLSFVITFIGFVIFLLLS